MSLRATWLVFSAVSVLAACGGGGDDAPPPGQQPGSAPVAVDDAAATVTGQPVTIPVLANDTDPDGAADIDPATVLVAGVTHGTTSVNTANGDVTFTPDAGFTGNASFNYAVSDRSGNRSQPARVTVAVNAPGNAAPAISDISDVSIAEDGATGRINFTVSDADTSAQNLAVTAQSSDPVLVPDSGLVLGGAGTKRHLTVTPAPDQAGTATITVRVSDGTASASDSFLLTVTAVNDAPVISNVPDQVIVEDTATGELAFTVGDVETAADALTVAATSSNEALVPAAGLTLGGSGAQRTVRAQPLADQSGTTTITLTVTDADGGQASDTFVLTVTGVNDRPVAQSASVSGDEDKALTGPLSASDVDSTSLTFKAASAPAHGTVTVETTGAFTYTPAANYAGGDSFTFVASDGELDSEPATVTITLADTAEPTLSLSGPAEPAAEDAGTVEFRVALSRAPDAPVTVRYQTADGTARAGADYTATAGELQFAPDGAHVFTVSVPVNDDSFDENDEDFTLALEVTAGADGVEPGATRVAAATIVDDDTSNLLRIGAAKRSVKPSAKHIAGVTESRLGSSERTQKFNLGGFGINPTQSLPNPADMAGEELTQPAESAAFSGSRGEEPIHVRAMVMQQPDGEAVMFVMLDAIGAGNIIQAGVKNAITAATGIPAENILFGQSHSHAGPDLQGLWGGVPETWIDCDASRAALDGCGEDDGWTKGLYQLAAEAAKEAFDTRRAARLTLAQGQNVQFNNYRRPRIDPDADADGTLTLLKAVADDGTPVGTILQYNAHPTSINESPRAVHADYIQGALDWVEDKAGGVGLYYNGPIADASGSGERANCAKVASDGNYGNVRCRGEGIADAALALTERELAPTLVADEREVILPITNPGFLAFGAIGSFNRYYNFMQQVPTEDVFGDEAKNLPQLTPTATTLVSRITIGGAESGLEIVTIPGEATNTFGQYIRGLAKTNVMLLGLTHNSFGYIVPEEEFSYVDQEGDDGLVAPFTGYEENVSLGPLTAPLLRTQGYNKLFAADPARDIPPALADCFRNSESAACIVQVLENRFDKLADDVSTCIEYGIGAEGCPLRTTFGLTVGQALGFFEQGCQAFTGEDPKDPDYEQGFCHTTFAGLRDSLGGAGAGERVPDLDLALVHDAALAQTAGCDPLDPSNCLYPFPNDWFTAEAAPGSVQSEDRGGTGRRVNIHPAATPRNSAGKPVDPSEWNRQDGFSPGALIATYVPGLSLEQTFDLPSHEIGLANLALSQDPNSPILVLEVGGGEPVRHLVWAEIDQNANQLTNLDAPVPETDDQREQLQEAAHEQGLADERGHVARPANDGKAALLIRPAKNFAEGKRYVVVLRNLKDRHGNAIRPQAGFRACLAGGSTLPPIQERCEKLAENVFPVLEDAGIALDESVFMAWDFTVQSTNNAIGRLRHMRDDAFAKLSGNPAAEDCTQLTEANWATCAAPQVRIVNVTTEGLKQGIAKKIEGTLKVPSYLVPVEPAPGDDGAASSAIHAMCDNASELEGDCRGDFRDLADTGQGLTAPNRLFFRPADGAPAPDPANPLDPLGVRYGDGLPDSIGSMEVRFLCQIPSKATPDTPARASLYGHGQLDRGVAITYEGVPEQARDHNYMFCAVDWFGFRTGDAGNVLSALVDLSNFPVIPDASQQGMLNFMYLARAMQHPRGLGALPDFQDAASGRPLFDRSEIFYDGNSQGGIFGGVVLAASKDVNRGVLGAVGMNYSTLLTRSANFDEYAGVLYGSYTDPLDRQLLFSMMQMLWDRSENDGYASHLIDNSAFGGPSNAVMLAPAFGDPQVTMWSADVMARTMGAVPVDMEQTLHVETLGAAFRGVNGRRHPDVVPYYGLPAMDFGSDAVNGSVLQVWDNDQLKGGYADVPPITNVPPYSTKEKGHDPHDTSQRTDDGRCVHAHFMRTGGTVIDAEALVYGGAACPAIPPARPTTKPGEEPAAGVLQQIVAAINAVLAPAQQAVADLMVAVAGELGGITGIALDPPGPGAAPGLPQPEPLMAGVAKRAIQVPVGTPLGGYLRPPVGGEYIGDDPAGEITDNQPSANDGCDPTAPATCFPNAPLPDEARKAHSPYATYSPPSRGYYDSLIAKAVALHDGNDYVVMVKTDFIGMLDEVVQDVKADVKAKTVSAAHPEGIDLGDGLIMSATHTHDGPGALANHSTRYFWLAMDLYQHDVYRRLVGQLADVVVAALADMKPARIGHGNGLESPNAGNGVNGYRRGRLASYADDDKPGCEFVPAALCPAGINDADELRKRIGILRVDDAATGTPLAVVINFADHGIAFDVENQYFSGDVLGAIEREVEQSYVRPEGDDDFRGPIAMLVQNTGGDVTPKNVPYDIRGIEMLGKRMAPQVRAVADAIDNFQDQPDLRSVSQRVILNRERLGYAEGEYPYAWGAAQCGNDIAVPFADVGVNDIPGYGETGLPRKHPYCIAATPPDAADLADNGVAENGAFVPGDTILTAAKIGAITLLVQPGEPLTEYGVRSLEMAQAEGFAPADTFIWGYAADHIGYILPPVEEDWATFGGAESTTTFWGWKQGQRFLDGHRELVRALRDGRAAPADEFQVNYELYRPMYDAIPAAQAMPSLLPGRVVAQPSDIKRFGKTEFVFEGGDPIIDLPHVTMLNGDGTPVRRANGEIIDTFYEMHLKYRLVSGRHLWTVEFEAPKDWAAGTYRFKVAGKARQNGTVDYPAESANFAVAPATNLTASGLACADGRCSVRVTYAAVPSNYRVVDANVSPRDAAPMRTGTVTFRSATATVVAQADGSGNFSAAIDGPVTATAVDAWGNTAPTATGGGDPAPAGTSGYGSGVIGLVAELVADLNGAVAAIVAGDPGALGSALEDAAGHARDNAEDLDPSSPATFIGLDQDPDDVLVRALSAQRDVEPVVLTGAQLEPWRGQPVAVGVAKPYPSGAGPYFDRPSQACGELPFAQARDFCYANLAAPLDAVVPHGDDIWTDPVRNAYNGTMLWPRGWQPGDTPSDVGHLPVDQLGAFRWNAATEAFEEIPVQVDERKPYFLANGNSGFSFYSGTDEELSYAWDTEGWGMTQGECAKAYDPAGWDTRPAAPDRNTGISGPIPDPVKGIDADDEIVFMASDAGTLGPMTGGYPADWAWVQIVRLNDPLDPAAERVVYLVQREGGSSFRDDKSHYVHYQRDADADQWIDRSFFADHKPADGTDPAPDRLGSSNTGYGPNIGGTVCKPDGSTAQSSDRFPRDGVTVTTGTYRWQASGRWMVRDLRVRQDGATPDPQYWPARPDLIDRWKGRAFQQSPDSTVSLVGFEDEQVNWEANSTLLGERCGPVRCIREVWGADSGTNVTKTETFYRDAVVYRYRVRVHPIPPDGLYTSWDYNRGAMVDPVNAGQEGRYFTALRPQGVPVDGRNDDVGQVDGLFGFPAYFDTADFTFNLPLSFDNWEQVSGKDDSGSLVYIFELKGPTSLLTPAVVPYYRDDACLDDGTGDDPVQRPWPGEAYDWDGGRVRRAYDTMAGRPLDHSGGTFADCVQRQGVHGAHGVHYFFTGDIDNAAAPKPVNEVDGQQWQFMVPTDRPRNIAEPYANVVRAPLQPTTIWYYASSEEPTAEQPHERGAGDVLVDFVAAIVDARDALLASAFGEALGAVIDGLNTLVAGVVDLLVGNDHASVRAVAEDVVYSPGDAGRDVVDGEGVLLSGYFGTGRGRVHAGVGVVDMTPDVGYGAGQYSPVNTALAAGVAGGDVDPYAGGKKQEPSYGVQSRLTGRAIVIEGSNGKRIALLKSDNYLAQDYLVRRVAQILAEQGSGIGYGQILYGVTHAHSSTYLSSPSWGVWVFQDAFDARFFEFQARKLADAILAAEASLKPARMGATTVHHKVYKGNVMGPKVADDRTPAGYPREFGDLGLVVMRIDEVDEAGAYVAPLAVWMNWGQHPEGLDGHSLHSPDYVGALERYVDRALGAPLVFSQGDVGSAESSGNKGQRIADDGHVCAGPGATGAGCASGEGVVRDWFHVGYAQGERGGHFLADAVIKGWKVIGGELPPDAPAGGPRPNNYVASIQVPFSQDFPVDYRNAWVPGPLSHPYPGVSACRAENTVEGNPGVPHAAECTNVPNGSPDSRAQVFWETLKQHGIPVPEHYELPAYEAVEENLRLKLQAFRVGDVVLGSCACEAQVDLILNFESRANDVEGDIYDGFDWACLIDGLKDDPAHAAACAVQKKHFDPDEFPYDLAPHPAATNRAPAAIAHMRAQVHNDARGWDAPDYVPYANAEPADPARIKGNFTKEELPAALGYKLAVGIGHAGDYNGYTVSYREYMGYDDYRKHLTAYGPHTADYMVTRLVRMAGAMKGGPELRPEPHDALAQADEARQVAASTAFGQATNAAYESFLAALPPDRGPAGVAGVASAQPRDIGWFEAATFTWRGGSTAVDNPRVAVQRCDAASAAACSEAQWRFHGDQHGEVQTRVRWPQGVPGLATTYGGGQEWLWTANFEAYEAFPAVLGHTPAGFYRFVVAGCINDFSAPDANTAARFTNLLYGLLPDAIAGEVRQPVACKSGATTYAVTSNAFRVVEGAKSVTGFASDGNGNLTIEVADRSIPRTYASVFRYVSTARDNAGTFCEECSFRPWAYSPAPPASVSVEVDGVTYPAAGSGTTWTASVGPEGNRTATVTVTYADGRVGRPWVAALTGMPQ